MHNLIKSRAVFEILKKPLPHTLRFYNERNREDSESDSEEFAAKPGEAKKATKTETEEEYDAASAQAKLNVNASEFVPRSMGSADEAGDELVVAVQGRKPVQPKLLLPWKGFPKPMRPERAHKARKFVKRSITYCLLPVSSLIPAAAATTQDIEQNPWIANAKAKAEAHMKLEKEPITLISSRKNYLKDTAQARAGPPDEKRLEQERKVALEALKLVEQRRMRESFDEKPQIIVHLTRSPVAFTPEERERVDRLRLIKREHIERVLRQMRYELKLQQQKDDPLPISNRYICLQRAIKPALETSSQQAVAEHPAILLETAAVAQSTPAVAADTPPRRYIPTVKQWDERCRAKANGEANGANKENNMAIKLLPKTEDSVQLAQPVQRAMVSSSLGNIMPKLQEAGSNDKDRKLFVPRYWPPTPMVASGETRRGNLTHARNISRAFANCGLLPTPTLGGEGHPYVNLSAEPLYYHVPHEAKPVKRYAIEELLQWEPQPHELQKPHFNEEFDKLGFMCQ